MYQSYSFVSQREKLVKGKESMALDASQVNTIGDANQ
jgi:hypothetical protein